MKEKGNIKNVSQKYELTQEEVLRYVVDYHVCNFCLYGGCRHYIQNLHYGAFLIVLF